MRRFAAGLLAGAGMAGPRFAQQPSTITVAPSGAAMPGTPVGTALVTPAATPVPKAVPAAGAKVGTGPTRHPGAARPAGAAGAADRPEERGRAVPGDAEPVAVVLGPAAGPVERAARAVVAAGAVDDLDAGDLRAATASARRNRCGCGT